jgi:exopolysaccharide production protein ExoZ
MPNLQILRFVAAALVLISHVQHEALKGTFLDISAYHPWTAIYFAGGVDIFFVISGFIMYAIASGDFGRPGAAGLFLLRRIARIVPPYWLFTTAMIAAAYVFSDHVTHSALDPAHILASYFFFPFDSPYGRAYPVLMLGWTLNFEFYFYMVFGAALLLRKPLGLALIFGLIGISAAFGMALMVDTMPFKFWSDPIVYEFLLGILLAMARERGWRLPVAGGWMLIALGVIVMLATMQAGIAATHWNFRVLWMGLPALAICAGVVLQPDSQGTPGPFKRLLVLLGDASYSIYLSHPFALNAVALGWRHTGWDGPWSYVAVASTVSLLAGLGVHLMIEKPMTRYFSRLLPGRKPAPLPVAQRV